jgi:hypothetical protein
MKQVGVAKALYAVSLIVTQVSVSPFLETVLGASVKKADQDNNRQAPLIGAE